MQKLNRHPTYFLTGILGFTLFFNLYLLPQQLTSPRLTDLIGALLWGWLLWRFIQRGVSFSFLLTAFVLLTIPLAWGLYSLQSFDLKTIVHTIRLFLALSWGYFLFESARNPHKLLVLQRGMWLGLMLQSAVIVAQFYGYLAQTVNWGLAPKDYVLFTVYGVLRSPGMEGHANASAAATSFILLVGLHLSMAHRKMWVFFLSLIFALLAANFASSRAAIVIGLMVVGIFFARRLLSRQILRTVLVALVGGAVILAFFGPPGGWQRWLDTSMNQNNLEDRSASIRVSTDLLLQHPFGMGVNLSSQSIAEQTRFSASHNSFLKMGLVYGLLFLILIAIVFAIPLQRLIFSQQPGFESWLALHLFGLFLFEDHFLNPYINILIAWLCFYSVTYLVRSVLLPARRRRTLQQHVN